MTQQIKCRLCCTFKKSWEYSRPGVYDSINISIKKTKTNLSVKLHSSVIKQIENRSMFNDQPNENLQNLTLLGDPGFWLDLLGFSMRTMSTKDNFLPNSNSDRRLVSSVYLRYFKKVYFLKMITKSVQLALQRIFFLCWASVIVKKCIISMLILYLVEWRIISLHNLSTFVYIYYCDKTLSI